MSTPRLLEGDTSVDVKGAPHKSSDIVVAIVDNDFTMKYLAHVKREFYLKPGNKA